MAEPTVKLPEYAELPVIDLYMDQLLGMVNQYTNELVDQPITKSMINSYVKKQIIEKPTNKKYSTDQLAELILISIYKSILPLPSIAKVLTIVRNNLAIAKVFDNVVYSFNNQLESTKKMEFSDGELIKKSAEFLAINQKIKQQINHL
ncbi:DUF1836 domain-containing protein [Lentilactobacillus sp. SPB1-3]|uniref:DUF1836 domain-containing protein n=1 Tax=Lentilactobacillus terminaliae TaxID=3003483 RepID=A0ACD5DE23_9LACO|nr:DUF1836 domain-containing protein [Lentilactobacillus sp. SPB1-3]MCZ0977794.1 DUF1836 domain-containing protein [Lentilactobacillus sp. SPB1-3]